MSKDIKFTDANFEKEVLQSNIPVFVDFWASWCPPCKMIEPVIEELAEELDGKIKVGKLNIDQNPKTSAMFQIAGAPTLMLLKEGKILMREVGARSKQQLLEMIKKAGIEIGIRGKG
ncbi:MAG: thioredoxin [Candidatus Ratteibacteria bacterium]|nr:thioredoxin [Candidatus Ratteibacteria bacterium]